MKILNTFLFLQVVLWMTVQPLASKEDNNVIELPKPFPAVLTQAYNDCVINAVASAIEYLTFPRFQDTQNNPLYPLKISRSGLYTLARYYAFSNIENWKKGVHSPWQHDYGVSLGDALIALDKVGCFPEKPVMLTGGYVVPGWDYSLRNTVISPEMFLIAFDADFDGINEAVEPLLVKGSILKEKDLCKIENPYAKIAKHIFYEPIERPQSFNTSFYETLKNYLRQQKAIVIGINATQDFIRAKGKTLIQGTGSAQDFHALLVLGYGPYLSYEECFFIQNSWGAGWGDQGRSYISKNYFEKHFYGGYAISIPHFF